MDSADCEVVRRLVEEVANQGRMMLVDDLVAADFREHVGPPGLPSDREVLKQVLASRWLFGNGGEYVISDLESQDGLVTLTLSAEGGEADPAPFRKHPHPLEGLGAGSSPLTPRRIYDPSRERGLEPHPSPSGNEGCRTPKVEEHRVRVVEGKISEHWGIKPLFSTPQP